MKIRKIILFVFCLLSLTFVLSSCGGMGRQSYNITFETNGGSTIASQEVFHDKKVTRPESDPTKEGHTFVDWFADEALTTVYNFETRVRKEFTIYAKWTVNSYKLSYQTNVEGYEIKGINVPFNKALEEPEIDEEKFVVKGSTFGGWYLDSEYKTQFTNSTKMPANDLTLYAKWVRNDHKVNIYVDGLEKEPITVKYGDKFADFKDQIEEPTKDGFNFIGWVLNKTDENIIADDYIVTKDIELHATWAKKTFSITFDSNGGSAVETQTYDFNDTLTAPQAPTKVGYTFAGWYIGETYFNFTTERMPANNLSLKAKWIANEYTVSYFANGGAGTLANSKLTVADELTIPTNTFTKVGYTFTGWNTMADGTGTAYNDGAKLVLDSSNPADIKLYAQWAATSYSISFVGDVVANPNKIDAKYDVNVTLPSLELMGYEFLGWNTKADGTGDSYSANQSVKNLSSTGDDVTLYAQWNHIEYTLTININNVKTEIKLHYNDEIPAQNTPVIEGQEFDYWFTMVDGQPVEYSFENAKMPNGNLNIIAQFKGQVTITFYSNGAIYDTITGFDGNDLIETISNPTKEGYTFEGWYTDNNTFENPYTLPTKFPSENQSVYAKWSINQYKVTVVYDNGEESDEFVLDFGSKLDEPVVSKIGYEFNGWKDDNNNTIVFANFTVPAKDVTITAQWTINEYTIDFDSMGGSEVSQIKQNYGTTLTLPTPTKTGYNFLGWAKEGSADLYNFTTVQAENVILVAQWEAKSFTITVIITTDGVEDDTEVIPVKYDQLIVDVLKYNFKEGNGFGGWFTDASLAEDYRFDYNDATLVSGDLTLYANQTLATYKVNFISAGNIIATATRQYNTPVSFDACVEENAQLAEAYSTLDPILGDFILKANAAQDAGKKYEENPTAENGAAAQAAKNAMDTAQGALITCIQTYIAILQTNSTIYSYIQALMANSINASELQNFYSIVRSLSVDYQALANYYAPLKSGETYIPKRDGYFFGGWFLGADTVLNGQGEGTPFNNITPASSIYADEVNIEVKWESLKAVDDLAIKKDKNNTITWSPIDKDQLKPGANETLSITYKISNINKDGSIVELASVKHDDTKEKYEYVFMTHETYNVAGTYNLAVIVLAEICDADGNVLRSYESDVKNSTVLEDFNMIVNPGEVTLTNEGEYYYKDEEAKTFYFFTNVDYDFPDTNSFELIEVVDGSANMVEINGRSIHTTSETGTFRFQNTAKQSDGSYKTTTYVATVFPYVSQFTLGTDLSNLSESNAQTSMFRGKDAKYTIGRAYEGINNTENGFNAYKNLFEYKNNGFRFDLNILSGGKTINTTDYIGYLTYKFYKAGTIIDNDSMGEYDATTDSWAFTAEPGNYKVEISISKLFVPMKLVEKEIIKPVTFEFTLDNSINVYTHDQFKAIFANTTIGSVLYNEGRVVRGISLHSNIEASINDNQYFDTKKANPLADLGTDRKKAGHTPISTYQDDLWTYSDDPNFEHGSVYKRISKTDLSEDYIINGNCFEMNGSNLPFVSIYARENLSSVTGYEIASVHVALIHYIVTNGSGSDEESSSILTVNNLKITGNTKKYNSEADGSTVAAMNRNSGGYLGIMGSYGVTLNVNNTIIQNTTVAINPNNETSLNVSTTVIKNSFSNAIYAFDNRDIVIRNCHFEDAGGAAIHVEDTESYEKTDGTQTFATKSIVDLDAATEIHNYVSGDEGFFKSRSFEILITGMKAQFQAGAEANGMSMIEKITDPATGLEYEKINLIMLAVPRGDNTREDGPWDIINGWKNYHSGGIYQGMNYNMQKFSITGADSTVQSAVATAMVEANRAKVVAGVKDYIMSAMSLTDEQATAYLDTAEGKAIVEQEIAKQIQNQISDYNKATTSKDLGTNSSVVPLQYSSNHAFGLGYGYMLTGYSIPTFGNSIIVTGVSGKKLS